MKKIILLIILCMMFTVSACTSVSDIEMSDAPEVHTETSIVEEGESNQNIIEDISNDKSENVFEEENYSETFEELVEEQSLWEQMVTCEKLSEDDRQSLQRFYPIFCENKEFILTFFAYGDEIITTMENPLGETEDIEFYSLQKFVLFDLFGSEEKELVICVDDLGEEYFIFYKEGEKYYCSYHSWKDLQIIYNSKICVGSSGAAETYFYRFEFLNHIVTDEVAKWEWNYEEQGDPVFNGIVEGKHVSEEAFEQWMEENCVEEVEWIYIN